MKQPYYFYSITEALGRLEYKKEYFLYDLNGGNYVCDKCDCLKYRASTRLTMAITPDGKNHYKYIQHWEYIPLNKDVTRELPKCK